MRSIILYAFLHILGNVTSTEIVLRLQDPPDSVTPVTVECNQTVTLRCVQANVEDELNWFFNGKSDLGTCEIIKETSDSVLRIHEYDSWVHDGVYECYSGMSSSSIRLRGGSENIVLPSGFRFCKGEENSHCDHAIACQVDSHGATSCICEKEWMGSRCGVPLQSTKPVIEGCGICTCARQHVVIAVLLVIIMVMSFWNFVNRQSNTYRAAESDDCTSKSESPIRDIC